MQSEIKEMLFFEDDDEQGILLMIDTIQKAHRYLLLRGLGSDISNSTIVSRNDISMIEQKLPNEMKREWTRVVTGGKCTEIAKAKFPSLLKLLIHFRERLEYEVSIIRGGISQKETLTSRRDGLRETSQQKATSEDAGFISPMVTMQYGIVESLPAKR